MFQTPNILSKYKYRKFWVRARVERTGRGSVLRVGVGRGSHSALSAPLLQHSWGDTACFRAVRHLGLAGWAVHWQYGPGWAHQLSTAKLEYQYIDLGGGLPGGNCGTETTQSSEEEFRDVDDEDDHDHEEITVTLPPPSGWGEWGAFSRCSGVCGQLGSKARTRLCSGPACSHSQQTQERPCYGQCH